MNIKRGLLAIGVALAWAGVAAGQTGGARTGYTYVREVSGDVAVDSRWNGKVTASRNMPISVGDAVDVSSGGRLEVGLADRNVLYLGGESRATFASIRDQQGEDDDDVSLIRLDEGSAILGATGSDERAVPRIDTEDATVYVGSGGRVRVNYDGNHGTVVIARAGNAEVRTRQGRYPLRAGEYLMVRGDEEPEVEQGAFSRDRFDIWAADRFESTFETRSATSRYVDEEYSADVSSLDGYGDWDYSGDYDTYVWRPRVAAGWSPYSNGSWYYTPAGLTWWSSDPWGWYPFHYGNWFFDASFSSWCWSPAYVYSPAWVYWCYTPSFVGWCPVGWYSFYSPWYHNYYRNWGWTGRSGIYLSVNGRFNARSVDFRGWNFTGAGGVGAVGRMDVIPGARMTGRLGETVAVSSRPIVVPTRPGGAREAVQSFVREAPRTIERTARPDSDRLAPILARERTLPAGSAQALRDHAVIAERGRLAGPGVADIAPRGARIDRTRTLETRGDENPGGPGRTLDRGRPAADSGSVAGSARNPVAPRTVIRGDERGVEARSGEPSADTWRSAPRSRDRQPRDLGSRDVPPSDRVARPAPRAEDSARPAPPSSDWRGRGSEAAPARPIAPRSVDRGSPIERPTVLERSGDDWRSRPVPPARRVIEGAVPGRRVPDSDFRGGSRTEGGFRSRESAPRSPEFRQPAPSFRNAPPPRSNPAPPPRFEPRSEIRQSAPPPSREMRSAPPPRVERAAPPPPQHAAPAPRSAPPPPRSGPNRGGRRG